MDVNIKNLKLLKEVIVYVLGRESDSNTSKHTVINDKICSLNPNDNRKRKIGTKNTLQLKDTEIVKLRKYFKKTSPKKHHICILAYILSLMEDKDGLIINSVLEKNCRGNVIVIKIAEWIMDPKKIDLLKILRIDDNQKNIVKSKKREEKNQEIKTKILLKDWSFLIKDFFDKDKGFFDELKLLHDKNEKLVNNLYEFVIVGKMIDNNIVDKTKKLIEKLTPLNTVLCKVITAPIDSPEDSYSDWQFESINNFMNIDNGYCYTYSYLAGLVIIGRGKVNLLGGKINKHNIREIAHGIACYYHKYPEFQKEEISDYINTYNSLEISFVEKYIHSIPMKENEIYNLFNYLMSHLQEDLEKAGAGFLMNYSCNTIIELLGLMGYMLCSDDFINQLNNNFDVSQYCIGELLDFLEKLKFIKTGSSGSLYDIIKNISIDNIHLEKMISTISENCIHMMGSNFIKFYIKCHVLSQKYISFSSKNNVSCIPDDATSSEYDDLYRLSPYLTKLNEDLVSKTGIYHLTTIKIDSIVKTNAINTQWYVIGFDENGDSKKLFYIDGSYRYKSYNINDISNCFDIYGDYHFHVYSSKYNSIAQYYKNYREKLIDLIRISHVFQRDRKHTFLMYKDYALHICKLINADHNTDKLYKSIKLRCSMPYTNVITFDEFKHIPKWMGIIHIPKNHKNRWIWEPEFTKEHKPKVNVNNSNNSKINKEYYIDRLQNIFDLNYNYDSIQRKADVTNPYNHQNITRTYQYGKLLEKMLFKTGFKQIKHGNIFTVRDNELESIVSDIWCNFHDYYLKLYGQGSEIVENYWSKLEIQFVKYGKITRNSQHLTKIKTSIINKEEKELLSIIENINCINAAESLYKINKMKNKTTEKFINLSVLTNEIVCRLKLFIDILKAYYLIVLPFNYDSTLQYYYSNISKKININLYQTIFHIHNSLQNNNYNNLKIYYNKMLLYPILTMFSEGWDIATYQYNFTEINSEFFLIKQMKSNLANQSIPHTSQYKNIIPLYYHKPLWVNDFEKLLPIINNTFSYYEDKEKDKMNLRVNDIQESVKIQFEYWLKIQLIDKHLLRMTHWSQLEKFLLFFSDIDSSTRLSINDLTTLNSLKQSYKIQNKWNNPMDFYKECIENSIDNKNYITFFFSIMQGYIF